MRYRDLIAGSKPRENRNERKRRLNRSQQNDLHGKRSVEDQDV